MMPRGWSDDANKTSSSGRQRHADHDANWTKSQDEGHVVATKGGRTAPAPLLGTFINGYKDTAAAFIDIDARWFQSVKHSVKQVLSADSPIPHGYPQLRVDSMLNESVLGPTVMDEGQPRANESGPLTILQPLSHGRRCDASMPTRARVPHSASTSSEHAGPTEPTPLSECIVSTLAEIITREHIKEN